MTMFLEQLAHNLTPLESSVGKMNSVLWRSGICALITYYFFWHSFIGKEVDDDNCSIPSHCCMPLPVEVTLRGLKGPVSFFHSLPRPFFRGEWANIKE